MGKKYCTQNNGDCLTCSFTNYGRDCNNNPIADDSDNLYWIATPELSACCGELIERAHTTNGIWIYECSGCDKRIIAK